MRRMFGAKGEKERLMAPRASWKGFLTVGELACGVALHPAATTSDRIAFHTLNRRTGHRVQRVYVDSETGEPVEPEDQVKGYETGPDTHVVLTAREVALAVPDSDKTLSVGAFVKCADIDTLYLDKPYHVVPADGAAAATLALIRDGLRARKVAALAQAVLFRRVRTVLIRAQSTGLIGTTLNFDHEVRSAAEAFADLPDIAVDAGMLDLALAIVRARRGRFDPQGFDDRYEAALADLVGARIEGRRPEPRFQPRPQPEPVADLLEALRESALACGRKARRGAAGTGRGSPRTPSRAARRAG